MPGKVSFREERCKGCELCLYVCPRHIIVLRSTTNAKGYHPATVERMSDGKGALASAGKSEQPEHRAAERAALRKERGTLPRGNFVKERQRRAFRLAVGGNAFVCREREHQRAMKRGDVGAAHERRFQRP